MIVRFFGYNYINSITLKLNKNGTPHNFMIHNDKLCPDNNELKKVNPLHIYKDNQWTGKCKLKYDNYIYVILLDNEKS